jgi:(p)ppGpp synthase/HD superfamily hydrolase
MKYLERYEAYSPERYRLTKFINKVKSAYKFAEDAHAGVKRKGGDPYFSHPDAVAKIIHDVKESEYIAHLISAAYLHDVVEDTDVTLDEIRHIFGELVAELVGEVTSDKDKIAISGKEEYLIDKMIGMSSWALVIKLADRLHNLSDFQEIMDGDDEKRKKWAIKYAEQTKNIIDEIEWYRELSETQKTLVDKIRHKLNIVL